MAVAVLVIALSIVVPAAFVWAYGKIREPPETEDEEDDRRRVGV
jgi:hypothetical protein